MTSQIKTLFLLALLSGIIIFIGNLIGGSTGIAVAIVFALAMNIGGYWFSDKIVLRMYRAQELKETEAPMIHAMVRELAHNAGIPTPRLYLIPDSTPNAFATGRNPQNAVVAVTEGIVRLLDPDELRGVIAHEIGHILNRDILIQSIAGVMATAISALANFAFFFGGSRDGESHNPIVGLLLIILAPLAASLVQMSISRSREYLADSTGANLSGKPLALASALEKLTSASRVQPMHEGSPATAHMFIVNPFSGMKAAALFSTHPTVEDRVARLRAMAR